MIVINQRSNKPLYEQIYMQVIKLIADNIYTFNDKLPSIREMAVDIKVNPNTIQRAYQNLETDEIIYSVKGKGYFVGIEDNLKEVIVKNDRVNIKDDIEYLKSIGFNKNEIKNIVDDILVKMEDKNA